MDFISMFDLNLNKDVYYAGDNIIGNVVVENTQSMRFGGIKLHCRGKAHAEWKVTRAGERRTVKQEEYYIDEKQDLWGDFDSSRKQVATEATNGKVTECYMPRGSHAFSFKIKLPLTSLPCSFESKYGNIRYYITFSLEVPYASSPQGMKYFTVVGPHIDCMDERLLIPKQIVAKTNNCSWCCGKGPLLMNGWMEKSGYCCGENIGLKLDIENGGSCYAWIRCQLVQHVDFFIDKGVLGLSKEVRRIIVEVESERVPPDSDCTSQTLRSSLQIPVCPPTMMEACNLLTIYYILKLYLETEQEKESAEISLPLTITPLPFCKDNSPAPKIKYEQASEKAEGGNYISSEFQLGQVYMGDEDDTIIYRPVYVTIMASRPLSVSGCQSGSNVLQVNIFFYVLDIVCWATYVY